jgi:hypothetical protein
MDPDEISNLYRNRPITSKNCLWWPFLSIDPDEMSNLYIASPLDAFYEVSFGHLVSAENNLKNQPIRKKNHLWRSCLLTDREK